MRAAMVLLLVLMASAACNRSSPTAPEDAALALETVVKASQSGFSEPQRRVVRGEGEWDEVWRTLAAGQTPAVPRPPVDFGREIVVLAASGVRSNGYYSIEATRALLTGDGSVELEVVETVPGPGCACTQAVTRPAHLVRMARFPGREIFIDRVRELAC